MFEKEFEETRALMEKLIRLPCCEGTKYICDKCAFHDPLTRGEKCMVLKLYECAEYTGIVE